MRELENINNFNPISLNELDKAELLNRIDTKYLINKNILPKILESIQKQYFVLDINSTRIFNYNTIYYDTDSYMLYLFHHNGKLNRYKVRKREYKNNRLYFLEIKYKTNKGRTIKERKKLNSIDYELTEDEILFLNKHIPIDSRCLKPKLTSQFKRITLVNNHFNERVTIDYDLAFINCTEKINLENIAIIELKQDKSIKDSLLKILLSENKMYPCSFSKYACGNALINKQIKTNNFKEKIQHLNKLQYA
jgi:hypothetical protein